MQAKKQQSEPDMEEWTGSKLGKEYVKAVYCHSAYLTYMQSVSECEVTQSRATLCDPWTVIHQVSPACASFNPAFTQCTLHIGKEMATHSSILVWRIPWTEDPGGLHSSGSQRVGHG